MSSYNRQQMYSNCCSSKGLYGDQSHFWEKKEERHWNNNGREREKDMLVAQVIVSTDTS